MDLDDYFPYRLAITAEAVSRHVARVYGEAHDLSRQEWRIVAVLGETDRIIASAFRDLTTMDKSSVSRALRALESKGLIVRSPCEHDRRDLWVALSDEGRVLHCTILPQATEAADRLLRDFSAEEKARLIAFLIRIQHACATDAEKSAPD